MTSQRKYVKIPLDYGQHLVCQNWTLSELRSEHIIRRPYKELLNALFSFEIRHSVLKLWTVKEKASKQQKTPLYYGL